MTTEMAQSQPMENVCDLNADIRNNIDIKIEAGFPVDETLTASLDKAYLPPTKAANLERQGVTDGALLFYVRPRDFGPAKRGDLLEAESGSMLLTYKIPMGEILSRSRQYGPPGSTIKTLDAPDLDLTGLSADNIARPDGTFPNYEEVYFSGPDSNPDTIITCRYRQASSGKDICNQIIRRKGITLNLKYDRSFLNDWKRIDEDMKRFFDCTISSSAKGLAG